MQKRLKNVPHERLKLDKRTKQGTRGICQSGSEAEKQRGNYLKTVGVGLSDAMYTTDRGSLPRTAETRSALGAGPTSRNRMSASVCLPSETARDQQSGGVRVVIKTCLSHDVSRRVLSSLTTDSRREAAGG